MVRCAPSDAPICRVGERPLLFPWTRTPPGGATIAVASATDVCDRRGGLPRGRRGLFWTAARGRPNYAMYAPASDLKNGSLHCKGVNSCFFSKHFGTCHSDPAQRASLGPPCAGASSWPAVRGKNLCIFCFKRGDSSLSRRAGSLRMTVRLVAAPPQSGARPRCILGEGNAETLRRARGEKLWSLSILFP